MPIVEGENTIEQENTNSYNEINNTQEQEQNQIPQSTIATVEVTDEKTPIIFLFGAPNSGKTMTLVRLYRYLFKNQITIVAEKSFVTNDGDKYKEKCNKFTENANLDKAAEATKGVDFMLLKIFDNDRDICQILESPGEKLFHPDPNEDKGFPVKYVSKIINSNNKKIYIIFLEPNWKDQSTRRRYVERIKLLKKKMDPRDKVIFLYNKIDESSTLNKKGRVVMSSLKKQINNEYPGLLNLFENEGIISRFWREYDCFLVPFQTGDYSVEQDNNTNTNIKVFTEGKDLYPKHLWETIKKCL